MILLHPTLNPTHQCESRVDHEEMYNVEYQERLLSTLVHEANMP